MVHALGTGLAILELPLGGSAAQPNTAATLRRLFQLLAESGPPSTERPWSIRHERVARQSDPAEGARLISTVSSPAGSRDRRP